MQRGRAGSLSAGQDEIEPLDFAPPASKHRHESKTADPISQSASPKQKTGAPDVVDVFL